MGREGHKGRFWDGLRGVGKGMLIPADLPVLSRSFTYISQPVRVVGTPEEPLFVASDVCACLEVANSRDALARLDEDEKGVATTDTPGGQQQMAVVTEAGLYSLILTSRKPEAKAFKRWVTHEVLPQVRKTGAYGRAPMTQLQVLQTVVQQMVVQETALREQTEKTRALEARQDAQEAITSMVARDTAELVRRREETDREVQESLRMVYPEPEEVVPVVTTRGWVTRLVTRYAQGSETAYAMVWNRLYEEFRLRHHHDLKRRARNAGGRTHPLDIAEHNGWLGQLYDLALELFGPARGS
jgi:prophage antirepressor-like protein